jgi:hypothetical protein
VAKELHELIVNVKYKGKPRAIGEKIEIDDKDLEFFKTRKLIKPNGEEAPNNDPPKEKTLSQMNATELKAIAEKLEVVGFDNMTKEQLREAIQGKQAEDHLNELRDKVKAAGIDGFETMAEEELIQALGE